MMGGGGGIFSRPKVDAGGNKDGGVIRACRIRRKAQGGREGKV